jgi:hypothetical protein
LRQAPIVFDEAALHTAAVTFRIATVTCTFRPRILPVRANQ